MTRILLVDDNNINQKVGQRMLQQIGYQPEVVTNGKEADRLDVPWGQAHSPEMLADALKKKFYEAVTIVHNETSTGATTRVPRRARPSPARRRGLPRRCAPIRARSTPRSSTTPS